MIKDIAEFTYIIDKKERFNELVFSYPESLRDMIKDRLSFEYPYEINNDIKTKYSVSEIKHNAMEEAFEEEKQSMIPKFIEGENS